MKLRPSGAMGKSFIRLLLMAEHGDNLPIPVPWATELESSPTTRQVINVFHKIYYLCQHIISLFLFNIYIFKVLV